MKREDVQSDGELHLSWMFDELYNAGIIKRYLYESNTFTLSRARTYPILEIKKTKTKLKKLSFLQEHVYSPDFLLEWDEKYLNKFFRIIEDDTCTVKCPFFAIRSTKDNKPYTFIECKPVFDQNSMSRLFRINQKWLYDKYGLFVQLCIVPTIFEKMFTPDRFRLTDKTMQQRTLKYEPITLNEYLIKLDI